MPGGGIQRGRVGRRAGTYTRRCSPSCRRSARNREPSGASIHRTSFQSSSRALISTRARSAGKIPAALLDAPESASSTERPSTQQHQGGMASKRARMPRLDRSKASEHVVLEGIEKVEEVTRVHGPAAAARADQRGVLAARTRGSRGRACGSPSERGASIAASHRRGA